MAYRYKNPDEIFRMDMQTREEAQGYTGMQVVNAFEQNINRIVYNNKEVTEDILEAHADTIFEQAENRLHAQKAILSWLAVEGR